MDSKNYFNEIWVIRQLSAQVFKQQCAELSMKRSIKAKLETTKPIAG